MQLMVVYYNLFGVLRIILRYGMGEDEGRGGNTNLICRLLMFKFGSKIKAFIQ